MARQRNLDAKNFNACSIVWHLKYEHKDGSVSTYTLDDMKDFVDTYRLNGKVEVFAVIHDKDPSIETASGICNPHMHIKMRYVNKNSKFNKDDLLAIVPDFDVQPCYDWEKSMAYLIHVDSKSQELGKHVYEFKDLITNESEEKFNEYLNYANDVDASYKERERMRDESRKMKYQITLNDYERKMQSALVEAAYKELRDDIYDGKLKYRTWGDYVVDASGNPYGFDTTMFRDIKDDYGPKIEKAYAMRYKYLKEHLKDRNLDVVFVEGGSGVGKTLFAIEFARELKKLYSLSSSKNDPLQDMLPDDDCFILNDVRDSTFTFQDFLMMTETYVNTSVKSRYANKTFFGDLLIITSFQPLDDWYVDTCEDKAYDDEHDPRVQFNRRIHKLVRVKEAVIEIYKHHEDGTNDLEQTIPNPAYLLDRKFAHKLHFGDEAFEKTAYACANKLNLTSAYEEYKKLDCSEIQKQVEVELKDKTLTKEGKELDAMFLVDRFVKEATDKGISKSDVLKYLRNELKRYD